MHAFVVRYGDLPAHGGLWEDALRTAHSLEARLVLEHCVHEAKGLDITQLVTVPKFRDNGDAATAALLTDTILPEEITHVAFGLKWFRFLQPAPAAAHDADDAAAAAARVARFRALVAQYFHGGALRGPFNVTARAAAGMTPAYYDYALAAAPAAPAAAQ